MIRALKDNVSEAKLYNWNIVRADSSLHAVGVNFNLVQGDPTVCSDDLIEMRASYDIWERFESLDYAENPVALTRVVHEEHFVARAVVVIRQR